MGVSGATGMKYPGVRVKSFLLPYHPLSSQLLVAKFSDRPKGWGRGHIYRGCGAPPRGWLPFALAGAAISGTF